MHKTETWTPPEKVFRGHPTPKSLRLTADQIDAAIREGSDPGAFGTGYMQALAGLLRKAARDIDFYQSSAHGLARTLDQKRGGNDGR